MNPVGAVVFILVFVVFSVGFLLFLFSPTWVRAERKRPERKHSKPPLKIYLLFGSVGDKAKVFDYADARYVYYEIRLDYRGRKHWFERMYQ